MRRSARDGVEHPFGTLKMRMGATHFLMKTLPKVASEMALCVLAYNLTRVMNIVGTEALLGDQGVRAKNAVAADLEPDLAHTPVVTQRWPLIVQQ